MRIREKERERLRSSVCCFTHRIIHERVVRLRERIGRAGRECGITDYGFTAWNVELTRSKVPLFKASQISSASRPLKAYAAASTIRSPRWETEIILSCLLLAAGPSPEIYLVYDNNDTRIAGPDAPSVTDRSRQRATMAARNFDRVVHRELNDAEPRHGTANTSL